MILVTGGTGMLGSYLLLELLKKEEKVMACKRPTSNLNITKKIFKTYSSNPEELLTKIQWVDVDLFSQNNIEEQLDGVSTIYHCAAQIQNTKKDSTDIIENNTVITKNIVNAALNQRVKRFCYVSSIAALGSSTNHELISEATLWKNTKNNSTYSMSKYSSEMEVWRGIAEGLNAVIINPSVILGIGHWEKGSANLFEKMASGFKFYTLGSSGFVSAKDTVKIMTQLIENESSFGQSFIVSSENLNFKQLFDKITKSLNVKSPSIYANSFLTQLACSFEWLKSKIFGFEPLITRESARTAHKVLKYDNSKLLQVLPFEYQSIDSAIAEIAQAYLHEKQILR